MSLMSDPSQEHLERIQPPCDLAAPDWSQGARLSAPRAELLTPLKNIEVKFLKVQSQNQSRFEGSIWRQRDGNTSTTTEVFLDLPLLMRSMKSVARALGPFLGEALANLARKARRLVMQHNSA